MSVRMILEGANEILLRTVAERIKERNQEIDALLGDLCDTAIASAGVGLAAPQIGVGLRACVVRIDGKFVSLLNPEIIWKSEEEDIMEEGCLSLPRTTVPVPRARAIALRYRDRKWKKQERKFFDLEARIVQHEVDHLDGVLIVDYREDRVACG